MATSFLGAEKRPSFAESLMGNIDGVPDDTQGRVCEWIKKTLTVKQKR